MQRAPVGADNKLLTELMNKDHLHLQTTMGRSRSQLDPRDMKAAYVVSDDNGYYDRCDNSLKRNINIKAETARTSSVCGTQV